MPGYTSSTSPYVQGVSGYNTQTGQGGQISGPMSMGGVQSIPGMANQFASQNTPNNGYYQGGYGQTSHTQAQGGRPISGQASYVTQPMGFGGNSWQSQGYKSDPNSFRPGGIPGGGGQYDNRGGFGGINPQLMGLLGAQQADNMWARNNNEKNWQMARDTLLGVQGRYANDSIVKATQGRVGQMLADPEAINDRVQSMIQNKAANSIDSQNAAMASRQAGILAAGGHSDAGSIGAMMERLGRQGMAQRQSVQSGLEVQRANQRNQDMYNAINSGRGQSAADYGIQMDTANTLIGNLPQYQPMDMSGWIAALGNQGQQGGGYPGMGGGYGMQPQGQPDYGFGGGYQIAQSRPVGNGYGAQGYFDGQGGGVGVMGGGTGLMQFQQQDSGRWNPPMTGNYASTAGSPSRWGAPVLQGQGGIVGVTQNNNAQAVDDAFNQGSPFGPVAR